MAGRRRKPASRASSDTAGLVSAVVTGTDVYRWVDEDGVIQEAERGDEIEVTADEFDRAPGALTKAGSKAAKAVQEGVEDGSTTPTGWPTSHEELDKLAEENDVVFAQHVRTPSEKITTLEQAGVAPPSE